MNDFLLGCTSTGFLVAALFFRRYWLGTRDRFFALFALAFAIMGVNQFALMIAGEDSEFGPWLYVVRLASFVVILIAIIDKNRN